MHHIEFDEKLVKRVKFTEEFKQRLKDSLAGSVVVFKGSEIESVSAVSTLLAGLQTNTKYHSAGAVILGVIAWHGDESKQHESFKFSMEAFQAVGFGYLDAELAAICNTDKCLKFRLWLRNAIKRRVLKGETTIFAVPEMMDADLKIFFGRDLMANYGIIVSTEDVVEAEHGKATKRKARMSRSDI